jgi:hypothetical protein
MILNWMMERARARACVCALVYKRNEMENWEWAELHSDYL